jgi:hypothetical protein
MQNFDPQNDGKQVTKAGQEFRAYIRPSRAATGNLIFIYLLYEIPSYGVYLFLFVSGLDGWQSQPIS